MSKIDRARLQRSLLPALSVLLVACGSSRNIQLQFLTPKDAAERHRCLAMDKTTPEMVDPNCTDSSPNDDRLENKANTTHVLIAKCTRTPDPYVYYKITVLNSDTEHPTVLVVCGQNPPIVQ